MSSTYRVIVVAAYAMLWQATVLSAEEFVSEQYGFHFHVPAGFYEFDDGTPMALKMFAEDEQLVDDYLITIHILRLGQIVDPRQRLAPSQLPTSEGRTVTPEIRRWQGVELQAARIDEYVDPDTPFVAYLIQFPLASEGIRIQVQGPMSRQERVLSVFNESVESFVNLRPFIVSVEPYQPGKATRAAKSFLFAILPPLAILSMLVYFIIRVRKSGAQT